MFKTKGGALINPAQVTHIDTESINDRLYWYVYLVGGARVKIATTDVEPLKEAVENWMYMMAPKSSVL